MNPLLSKTLRILPGLMLLSLLGCALHDYEDKMKQTQMRLKHFDDEKRLLDEPVELPKKRVKDRSEKGFHEEPIVPIFLRPPLGIGKKPSAPEHGVLYKFSRKPAVSAGPPGQQAPPGQGSVPAGPSTPVQEVYLAWDTDKGDQKKFIDEILRLFPRKNPRTPPTEKELPTQLPDREPISLRTYEFLDPQDNTYSVWFRSKGKWHVAVGFRIEKGKQGLAAEEAMRLSAESLAIEDEIPLAIELAKRSAPRPEPPPASPPPGQPAPP